MMAIELAGGYAAAVTFIESLRLVTNAVSLGGVDTLAQHPASLTHRPVAPEARPGGGIVRISVGLEHVDDLAADILAALDQVSRSRDATCGWIRCAGATATRLSRAATGGLVSRTRSSPLTCASAAKVKVARMKVPASASGNQCFASSHMSANGSSRIGNHSGASSLDSMGSPCHRRQRKAHDFWLNSGRCGNG